MEPLEPWPRCPEEDDMAYIPPPPPPSDKERDIKRKEKEYEINLERQMKMAEVQMKQAMIESQTHLDKMTEDLDNMMDFGLDFDLDDITDVIADAAEEVDTTASDILAKIRERPGKAYHESVSDMRYKFGAEGGSGGQGGNSSGTVNCGAAEVYSPYEPLLGSEEKVDGKGYAELRMKKVLKLIRDDWRYRIKEILFSNGTSKFIPQRRSWGTLGFWESGGKHSTLSDAAQVVDNWLGHDPSKKEVKLHGVAPKKLKGYRNEIMQQIRDMNDGPPRKRPPPPPPPPLPRTVHEGIPNPFEVELIPASKPEMPQNESIGNYQSVSSYDLGYNPGADDVNRGTLTTERTPEDEEKSMIVDLKKSLLD